MSLFTECVLDEKPLAFWPLRDGAILADEAVGNLYALSVAATAPTAGTLDLDVLDTTLGRDFTGAGTTEFYSRAAFPFPTGDFTIAWIMKAAGGRVPWSYAGPANENELAFWMNPAASNQDVYLKALLATSAAVTATDAVHFWAIRRDGTSGLVEVLKDGAIVASGTGSTAAILSGGTFRIGQTRTPTVGNGFVGTVGGVALFSYTLTDDQLATLHEASREGTFGVQLLGAAGVGLYPTVKLEAALPTRPTATYQEWTDLTPWLRGLSWERMRQHELDRFESPKMAATLSNEDGRFFKDNLDSPYYGLLKSTRKLRIRTCWDGVLTPRWAGYAEDWPPKYTHMGFDQTVTLTGSGKFKVLNLAKLPAGFSRPQELSGARLAAILAEAGIPAAELDLDAGQATVAAEADLGGTSVLAHAQAVEETEQGQFFEDADGKLVFHDRHHRTLYESVSLYSFGPGDGELPYYTLERDESDGQIVNDVRVTPSSGSVQTAEDAASQLDYFTRTREFTTLHAVNNDALSMAQAVRDRYAQPATRIPSMTTSGVVSPDELWPVLETLEIGNHVIAVDRPLDPTEAIGYDVHVEGVREILTKQTWDHEYVLSPADTQTYWILGTALLGTDTRLSW